MTQEERDIARDRTKDYEELTSFIERIKANIRSISDNRIEEIRLSNKECIRLVGEREDFSEEIKKLLLNKLNAKLRESIKERALIYDQDSIELDDYDYKIDKQKVKMFDDYRSELMLLNNTLKTTKENELYRLNLDKCIYIHLPENISKSTHSFIKSELEKEIESIEAKISKI